MVLVSYATLYNYICQYNKKLNETNQAVCAVALQVSCLIIVEVNLICLYFYNFELSQEYLDSMYFYWDPGKINQFFSLYS